MLCLRGRQDSTGGGQAERRPVSVDRRSSDIQLCPLSTISHAHHPPMPSRSAPQDRAPRLYERQSFDRMSHSRVALYILGQHCVCVGQEDRFVRFNMVPFGGSSTPLSHADVGQVASHKHVRSSAVLSDGGHMVQHMGVQVPRPTRRSLPLAPHTVLLVFITLFQLDALIPDSPIRRHPRITDHYQTRTRGTS